jgi:hypothetical protein
MQIYHGTLKDFVADGISGQRGLKSMNTLQNARKAVGDCDHST